MGIFLFLINAITLYSEVVCVNISKYISLHELTICNIVYQGLNSLVPKTDIEVLFIVSS